MHMYIYSVNIIVEFSRMNQKQADIISRLNNVMTKSIERLMDEGDLGIESLCLLSPTCVNQKGMILNRCYLLGETK